MKHLKLLAVLALLVAVSAPAFAETQTVKVSGALDSYWFYRRNLDLRDGNDAGSVPFGVAVPAANAGAGTTINASEGDNFFMSIAQVEVAADLTDSVSVVINLLNQRDWNADTYEASAGADLARGAENREEEFDVAVDLAYAQMKEIFYAPLTLTFGRQDLWFGRGFIVGANYQDPNNSIGANEFTGVVSFDAVRATLDFEPWTIDVVYANIDENSHDAERDTQFWFTNVNYQFAEYNAEWEGYWHIDSDKDLVGGAPGAAGTIDTPRTAPDNLTQTVGTRAQFDPIQQITLGGEIAVQFGDYFSAGAQPERERQALALELFGEYRWDYVWKPMAGVQYVHFSGDNGLLTTGDYEGWNQLYRGPTYGDIRDWQQIFYATALVSDQPAGTNQSHFALYGSLAPLEDLKIDGWVYWFQQDEPLIVLSGTGQSELSGDIGTEVDVHVTYDYTEDVSFNMWLAWFMPGELFDHQTQGGTAGSTDDNAFQSVSSVKVVF